MIADLGGFQVRPDFSNYSANDISDSGAVDQLDAAIRYDTTNADDVDKIFHAYAEHVYGQPPALTSSSLENMGWQQDEISNFLDGKHDTLTESEVRELIDYGKLEIVDGVLAPTGREEGTDLSSQINEVFKNYGDDLYGSSDKVLTQESLREMGWSKSDIKTVLIHSADSLTKSEVRDLIKTGQIEISDGKIQPAKSAELSLSDEIFSSGGGILDQNPDLTTYVSEGEEIFSSEGGVLVQNPDVTSYVSEGEEIFSSEGGVLVENQIGPLDQYDSIGSTLDEAWNELLNQ